LGFFYNVTNFLKVFAFGAKSQILRFCLEKMGTRMSGAIANYPLYYRVAYQNDRVQVIFEAISKVRSDHFKSFFELCGYL
jgi:hypothetical protein